MNQNQLLHLTDENLADINLSTLSTIELEDIEGGFFGILGSLWEGFKMGLEVGGIIGGAYLGARALA